MQMYTVDIWVYRERKKRYRNVSDAGLRRLPDHIKKKIVPEWSGKLVYINVYSKKTGKYVRRIYVN